jgi:translation initiation factor 3 subunit G
MMADDEPPQQVVEYRTENGKKIKVTRTIKRVKIVERVNVRAIERRRTWKKFGIALDKTFDQTTARGDIFQFQYEKVGKTEKKTMEEQIKREMQETMAKAGKTGAGAWTARRIQQEKDDLAAGGAVMRGPGGARLATTPGAYVPPGRGRGDDFPTIRVSNLDDDVQEHELGDLFSRYGTVFRVRLLFDKHTGNFKNIAFVSFYEREKAELAMQKLSGVGLHHLIMHLEWAKPTPAYGGGGGGGAGGR